MDALDVFARSVNVIMVLLLGVPLTAIVVWQVRAAARRQHPPPVAETIHLEFQCGDILTNIRPPADVVGEVRTIALDQAAHTRCWRCAPAVWNGAGPLWQPELRRAITDAWKEAGA